MGLSQRRCNVGRWSCHGCCELAESLASRLQAGVNYNEMTLL